MATETDQVDKNDSRKIASALIVLIFLLIIAMVLLVPALIEITTIYLSPGLGVKDSAVLSFFVTVILMVIFAISSGDGLLGEIQFILGSFFLFFVIIWLLIAWIF